MRALVVLVLVLVTALLVVAGDAPARHMALLRVWSTSLSIDVELSMTPANAPLSLGSREICKAVTMGSTFTVDVTVDEVDISDRLPPFFATIRSNPLVLNQVDDNVRMMIEPGGGTLDVSDQLAATAHGPGGG